MSKKSDNAKKKGKSKQSATDVSPEQRLEMVATAAYYIAERHGFTPGESAADWQAAEAEIDLLLKQDKKKKKKDKKKDKKKSGKDKKD